jgi:hypothetical protein
VSRTQRRIAAVIGIAIVFAQVATASASPVTSRNTPVPIITAPGKNQLGVNIVWDYKSEPAATLTQQITTTLNYVKSLHANAIAINFDLFVNGPTSNTIFPGSATPPANAMLQLIQAAKSKGLYVLLRPVIDEVNPKAPWRGLLKPTDRDAWFASYDQALKPFVYAARLGKADELAIECELESLGNDPRWSSVVVPYVRQWFSGTLMTNASWENPGLIPQKGLTWGIDTYRPLKLPASATVKQLTAGWNSWLKRLPLPEPLNKTYIVETGLAAQAAAYTHPSAGDFGTKIIPSVQSKWFAAACNFYRQHKFKGLYFYSTNLTNGPQTKAIGGVPMDFQGVTNTEIRNCFTGH